MRREGWAPPREKDQEGPLFRRPLQKRRERGTPTRSGRMQGARTFAYFWRGRPSGRLPKVSRRKGGTARQLETHSSEWSPVITVPAAHPDDEPSGAAVPPPAGAP